MAEIVDILWLLIQVLVGINLVLPLVFLIMWSLTMDRKNKVLMKSVNEADFAVIVTVYQHTSMLSEVVSSIMNQNYTNFHVYIVADNCGSAIIEFNQSGISVLRPDVVLASNTRSHMYAIQHFVRNHDYITIIDSDNVVDADYLRLLNTTLGSECLAVQGFRAAKNLNTTIACLDAARDIYYHFYDGKILSELGSSATLSGSGMAFEAKLYLEFLSTTQVAGAGFDKVLQAWLVSRNIRIHFNEKALVYDEKTSKSEQLVQQRSRWINSWFKYASLGFTITALGIKHLNKHQFLFGIILLRPPLFMFLAASILCILLNLVIGYYISVMVWILLLILFTSTFLVSLLRSNVDKRILLSLRNIPQFIYYQFVSLLKVRVANQLSVSTKHDREE